MPIQVEPQITTVRLYKTQLFTAEVLSPQVLAAGARRCAKSSDLARQVVGQAQPGYVRIVVCMRFRLAINWINQVGQANVHFTRPAL